MDKESKLILRKVIIDFILLVCVCLPFLFFRYWGRPFERGFFCDDESIRHPFRKSTVNNELMYGVGMGIPILVILVSEYLNFRGKKCKVRSFMKYKIPPWVWSSYHIIGVFGFGVALAKLSTEIGKYTIGRLRPHFLDVCKPDVDCASDEMKFKYITEFKCTGTTSSKLLRSMRLSFPSAHTSFATFAMIYIAVYVQRRFLWSGSKLLRHCVQYIFLGLGWFTGLSRISDYKHHWSDVLGGALVGLVTAILVFACISNLWEKEDELPPDEESGEPMPSTENANDSTVNPA